MPWQLEMALEAGKSGKFLSGSNGFGFSLPSSETVVRGVPLTV